MFALTTTPSFIRLRPVFSYVRNSSNDDQMNFNNDDNNYNNSEESDPNSKISRNSANREKRPFLASHCEHLSDAEHFRRQLIREISEGVRKIQNAGLGEHAIRDLNDSINKLLREKYHWNRRIRELGGKDYNKEERKAMILAEREGGGGGGGGDDGSGGGGGGWGIPGRWRRWG